MADRPIEAPRRRPTIPVVALRDGLAAGALPLIERSATWPRWSSLFDSVSLHEPASGDASRWHAHTIDGIERRFGRPLTFTPYASAEPCSARCRFCSETLRESASGTSPMSASMRPGASYFDSLGAALRALEGVPLAYSLSGLEATDDTRWLLQMLATLVAAGPGGPVVEGAVLYTNGNGFTREAPLLLDALQRLPLSWIEWSRHHDDAAANQSIMRFRDGAAVREHAAFATALRAALEVMEVRLVCVVQAGGVSTAADVTRYLAWARGLGVRHVIFRALSALPSSYQANGTQRYIESHRVEIDRLMLACIDDPAFRASHQPLALTSGYYFWNARWRSGDGQEVVFEAADYGVMHAHEDSERVYKLVFHANGNLCGGWQPERHVLWQAAR